MVEQFTEALRKQAGSRQEHHAQRDLKNDQRSPPLRLTDPGDTLPSLILER